MLQGFTGSTLDLNFANGNTPGGDNRARITGIRVVPVPKPATMALLGLAACGLGGYVRKRRRA